MELDPTTLMFREKGPGNCSRESFMDFLRAELDYTAAPGYAYEQRFIDIRPIAQYLVHQYTIRATDLLVAYIAMTYFDRFLSRKIDIPVLEHDKGFQHNLSSFVFCCVLIAFKECYPNYTVYCFMNTDSKMMADEDIQRLEERIREGLEHKVLPYMNAYYAVDFFLAQLLTEEEKHLIPLDLVHHLVLAFYGEIKYTEFKPSVFAASTILALCYKLHPELHPEFSRKLFSFEYLPEYKVAKCFDQMIKEDAKFEYALNPPEPPPLFYRETSRPDINKDKGKEVLIEDDPIDYATMSGNVYGATEEELLGDYYAESSAQYEDMYGSYGTAEEQVMGDYYSESSAPYEHVYATTEEEQVLENASQPEGSSEITTAEDLQENVDQPEGVSNFTVGEEVQENVAQMEPLSDTTIAEEGKENVVQLERVSESTVAEVPEDVAPPESISETTEAEEVQEAVAQLEHVYGTTVTEEVPVDVPQQQPSSEVAVAEQVEENVAPRECVSDITVAEEEPENVPQLERVSEITVVEEVPGNIPQPERVSETTVDEEVPENVPQPDHVSETTVAEEVLENVPQPEHVSKTTVAEEVPENVPQPEHVSEITVSKEVPENVPQAERVSETTVAEVPENVPQPEGVSEITVAEEVPENVPQPECVSETTVTEEVPERVSQLEHVYEITIAEEVQENVPQVQRSDITLEEVEEEDSKETVVIRYPNWLSNMPVRDPQHERDPERVEDEGYNPVQRILTCILPAVCKCFGYEIRSERSK